MEPLVRGACLERRGFTGPLRAAALASLLARMAAPGSERALGELLGPECEPRSRMRLSRVSAALRSPRRALADPLCAPVIDWFGLQHPVPRIALPHPCFEGAAAKPLQAPRGHSQEKRSACPRLPLGLGLDGSGCVRRGGVFADKVDEDPTRAERVATSEAPQQA